MADEQAALPDLLDVYGHTVDGISYLLHQLAGQLSVGALAKMPEAIAAARLVAATGRALKAGADREMSDAATRLDRATQSEAEYPRTDKMAARVLRDRVKDVLTEVHDLDTAAGRDAAANAVLVSLLFTVQRVGASRLFPGPLPSHPVADKIAKLLENVDRDTPERIIRECVRCAGLPSTAADRLFAE